MVSNQPRCDASDSLGILSYFKDEADLGNASRGSISLRIAKLSLDNADKQRFEIIGKGSVRYHLRANDREDAKRWIWALTASIQYFKDQGKAIVAQTAGAEDSDATLADRKSISSSSTRGRDMAKLSSRHRDDSLSEDDEENAVIPHKDTYTTAQNEIKALLAQQQQLLASVDNDRSAIEQLSSHSAQLLKKFDAFTTMSAEREAFLTRRIVKGHEAREQWEQNITLIAEEQQEMEQLLAKTVQENKRKRKALKAAQEHFQQAVATSSPTVQSPTGAVSKATGPSPFSKEFAQAINDGVEEKTGAAAAAPVASMSPDLMGPDVAAVGRILDKEMEHQESDMEDEDDEFFDAIDNNQIEAKVASTEKVPSGPALPESPSAPPAEITPQKPAKAPDYIAKSYKGHEGPLRTKLPITADNRPNVSLWAILKNSVGKDMSKITLPVILNEPISMLCRMAEDMEFTECLDVAARQRDPAIRTMYVAAFAMSNYSSTTGRIAKPFNPLLGETFEYVRPDKGYRYVSEQVSHHPPISACHADSRNFDYYGEVDVKSKFWGKSFELWPKGTAHVNLKVPKQYFAKEFEPLLKEAHGSPNAYSEHYSWKKVVTSVNGIILGSPSIDHYGDMTVRNHITGHRCVLTFKPRGWRGKDAAEIKGFCENANGERLWDIAGRWTDRLIARKVGQEFGDLSPDSKLPAGGSGVTSPVLSPGAGTPNTASLRERTHLLLWKNSPKPKEKTPFNLTPFAITLIDQPEQLTPYLCPTDTRFRPDQRCMERGEYDQAAVEKNRLEEKQRAVRKRREAGDLPEFQPRWFKRSTDKDTGENYWDFNEEYWELRDAAGAAHGDHSKWTGVQDIY